MAHLQVAVLGVGNIGGSLGRRWIAAGHQVTFGVANPETSAKAQTLKAEIGEKAAITTVAQAITDADVIVFAIPGKAMDETIAANADALAAKLVIDVANRMGDLAFNSAATFQRLVPTAHYARAFNTLGWENFVDSTFSGGPADMFYVSPEQNQATVETLIGDVGYRPIRLGAGDQVGLVDALLSLWFTLSRTYGRRLAFKMVTP